MRCLTLVFTSHAGCEIIPATNGRERVDELFVDWLMLCFMLLNRATIKQGHISIMLTGFESRHSILRTEHDIRGFRMFFVPQL